jgi:hypothetical protein
MPWDRKLLLLLTLYVPILGTLLDHGILFTVLFSPGQDIKLSVNCFSGPSDCPFSLYDFFRAK